MLDAPTAPAPAAARTVELSIRGMTCTACAARIEKKLTRIGPGVVAAVNFATEQATVTAPQVVPVRAMIAAVEDAGYAAGLIAPAAAPAPTGDQAAYLRRRLILALVFFVPLSDLSVTLSLFPSYRFTGWPWVLVALTLPVALWAAWPFHRAALKNARHGVFSMDTLVSLGVIAACGWSAYAMFGLDRGPSGPGASALPGLAHPAGGGIYLEVAAAVTTFLLAGRYYEARARRSAAGAMRKLAAAAAKDVCVLGAGGRGAAHPGRPVAARGHLRGPPGGEDRGGRRRTVRRVRGRPEHDDRRARPGRGRGRRRRHGRHHRPVRAAGRPGRPGRRAHPAGPARRPGWPGPGRQGGHPAAGRPGSAESSSRWCWRPRC